MAAPRWMIVPYNIHLWDGRDLRTQLGELSHIDICSLSDHPRVILVRSERTYAVWLPAHGEVILRGVDIWVDPVGPPDPTFVDFDLLVAREVEVGGAPLARRIGEAAPSEGGGDLNVFARCRRKIGKPGYRGVWYSGNWPAVVELDVESHVRTRVELLKPRPAP